MYKHRVNYYETDAMGVTHHSNYVRWMEEARIYMMDKLNFSYKRLNQIGIGSPVLEYTCKIKHSADFDDEIEIRLRCTEYNSVRLTIDYEMYKDQKLIATGETKHCFINEKGVPIRLNKDCKELDEVIKANLNKWIE